MTIHQACGSIAEYFLPKIFSNDGVRDQYVERATEGSYTLEEHCIALNSMALVERETRLEVSMNLYGQLVIASPLVKVHIKDMSNSGVNAFRLTISLTDPISLKECVTFEIHFLSCNRTSFSEKFATGFNEDSVRYFTPLRGTLDWVYSLIPTPVSS